MKLNIADNIDDLSHHAARWLADYIKEVLSHHNRFTISLSGGNTPKHLYKLLASDPYRNEIDWKKIHFFWGDERFVPADDDRNNAKMAFDELLSLVPVAKKQVHPIRTDTTPELSALAYEQLLHQYFDKQLYTFDLVLLGLGDNSHTLSLFPGYNDIIFEQTDWVKAFRLHEQNMHRVTLTAPVVNKAGRVAFLVNGNDKTEALQQVMMGKFDPLRHAAQIIRPLNGELYWFVDKSAASGLQYPV
jgi:6-phosphogluconolactonase